MNLDSELDQIEQDGQTEAELIDEETEAQDVMDDVDEMMDPDSTEEDLEEAFEMEVSEDDIHGYLVDEDDNEIGFILLDEDGNEQHYFYVDMDEYEIVDDGSGGAPAKGSVSSADDVIDLGITREGIAEATVDMNAIYRDGSAVFSELKDTIDEINDTFNALKRPHVASKAGEAGKAGAKLGM